MRTRWWRCFASTRRVIAPIVRTGFVHCLRRATCRGRACMAGVHALNRLIGLRWWCDYCVLHVWCAFFVCGVRMLDGVAWGGGERASALLGITNAHGRAVALLSITVGVIEAAFCQQQPPESPFPLVGIEHRRDECVCRSWAGTPAACAAFACSGKRLDPVLLADPAHL